MLGLIDVVMISNLLMMVIVGGYETFVSRLNLEGHPDQPEWLSHVNASVLKIKLAMAIIGISSIHLLRTFIEAGNLGTAHARNYTETGVMWQTIIHAVFIMSAIGIAYVDRISSDRRKRREHADGALTLSGRMHGSGRCAACDRRCAVMLAAMADAVARLLRRRRRLHAIHRLAVARGAGRRRFARDVRR